jgi:hypothetical protein
MTPDAHPTSLVTVVMAALRSGGPLRHVGGARDLTIGQFLDEQREEQMAIMRELTQARRAVGTHDRLVLDYRIFHVEADLRWLDHAAARLDTPAHETPEAWS